MEAETVNYSIEKKSLDNTPHCGDACACWENGQKTTLCVVDGLGHGPEAELAAKTAIGYVHRHLGDTIEDIFAGCNKELTFTRGVAMGLAVIDKKERTITYGGIGNTRILVLSDITIRLFSNYGIVGGGYRKFQTETRPIPNGTLVLMYTDGIEEMIDLFQYDGEVIRNLGRLSRAVLRDWAHDLDDAAVMVYKFEI